jgi:hypothetical protein
MDEGPPSPASTVAIAFKISRLSLAYKLVWRLAQHPRVRHAVERPLAGPDKIGKDARRAVHELGRLEHLQHLGVQLGTPPLTGRGRPVQPLVQPGDAHPEDRAAHRVRHAVEQPRQKPLVPRDVVLLWSADRQSDLLTSLLTVAQPADRRTAFEPRRG